MSAGFKIEMPLKQAHIQTFGDALDPYAVAIAAYETVPGGDWRLEAYCETAPQSDVITQALRKAAISNGIAAPQFRIGPPCPRWIGWRKIVVIFQP